jgi:hypothetical protein
MCLLNVLWLSSSCGSHDSEVGTSAKESPGVCSAPLGDNWCRKQHTSRRYRNSVNALHLTVTTGVTSRHMNNSNEAMYERIGAVLMLVCPIECYPVCAGKCVSTFSRTLQYLQNLEDVTSRQGVKFIGAFAIFRKATIRFVMSVRPPVCPHGTTRLPLDGFS